jgi:cytochrome c
MTLKTASFILLSLLLSCTANQSKLEQPQVATREQFYVIDGEDEPVDPEVIKKGEVLVAYSDCYQCHREENKAKGPSFSDIARRYPMQHVYIEMLARKVIDGGFGVWGYPVMSAHPKLSMEEAELMVLYVLSLEKK